MGCNHGRQMHNKSDCWFERSNFVNQASWICSQVMWNFPKIKVPKCLWIWSLGQGPRSHAWWRNGEDMRQRPKAPVLVTEEDMHGLKTLRLTWRSCRHCLEHSWVSSLIPILMKEVNGNGSGGWNFNSLHKWKAGWERSWRKIVNLKLPYGHIFL